MKPVDPLQPQSKDCVCVTQKVWLQWKLKERNYQNRAISFFQKSPWSVHFETPLLDNVSKLLMEPDSLLTVSALSLSLSLSFLFFCPVEPHFGLFEWTRSKLFPNVICIPITDNRISKFSFTDSWKIEGPGGLDLFEVWPDFSLGQNILQKLLCCWPK